MLTLCSRAQQTVTGKVVDSETKRPIKDAEIKIEGTTISTKTNIGGYFQLSVDSANTLIITSGDYETGDFKISPTLTKFQVALKPRTVDDGRVFTIVERQAEFPGGMSALYKFLNKHIKYPKADVVGRVFVEFIVEKDGSIDSTYIKIIKPLYPSCDEEAIRVVKEFPNWVPAKQNNIPVRSKFVLGVNFDRQ